MNRRRMIKILTTAALMGSLIPNIHSAYLYVGEDSELFDGLLSMLLSMDLIRVPMFAIIHFLPLYILIGLSADSVRSDFMVAEVYAVTRAGRRIDWIVRTILQLLILSGLYYVVMMLFTLLWLVLFGCGTVSLLHFSDFLHALLCGASLYATAILMANWAAMRMGRTYATVLTITLIIGLILLANGTARPSNITAFALNPVGRSFFDWRTLLDQRQAHENALAEDILYWTTWTIGLALAMGWCMQHKDLGVANDTGR